MSETTSSKRTLVGRVVSDRMDKTVTVDCRAPSQARDVQQDHRALKQVPRAQRQ
jgi:ribosomal protein S17